MIGTDKDALLCDLAETYGIYDLWALPVDTTAKLAYGLRDNSRIKKKIAGINVDYETLLLAAAVDRLSLLLWAQTEDGQNNRNRPASIAEALAGNNSKPKGFDSAEAFEMARAKFMKGEN